MGGDDAVLLAVGVLAGARKVTYALRGTATITAELLARPAIRSSKAIKDGSPRKKYGLMLSQVASC